MYNCTELDLHYFCLQQVVCICNDRNNQKIKSLANHCLDLRFRRPSAREIATSFQRVAKAEGYEVIPR